MNQKVNQYLGYIAAHVPGMDLHNAVFDFKNGEHSDIVIIDQKELFKFSRHDWSAGYLNNAVKTIGFIRNYTGVPLPGIRLLEPGVTQSNYAKGEPLHRDIVLLSKSYDQAALAEQMGGFLSKMRTIPLENARAARLDEDDEEKMTSKYWESEYREIQRKIDPYCDDSTRDYVSRLFESVLEKEDFFQYSPSVIHGNLTPCHIIYDFESHRLGTITGFGSSRIGDPAYDIGVLLSCLGETFLKRVCDYDKAIPEMMERARFYAAFQRVARARALADRITTRDFTDYRVDLTESDIMPIGKRY